MAQWIVPDVVTFLTTVIAYILIKKTSKGRKEEQENLKSVSVKNSTSSEKHQQQKQRFNEQMSTKRYKILKRIGMLSSIVSLGIAGIVQPSVVNGVYFLCFLGSSSWLSCYRQLGPKFAIFLRSISVLLMFHFTGIILYQSPMFQNIISDDSFLLRIIFGWKRIYSSKENTPNILDFNMHLNVDVYFNPIVLMVTYFIVTLTSCLILVKQTANIFSF